MSTWNSLPAFEIRVPSRLPLPFQSHALYLCGLAPAHVIGKTTQFPSVRVSTPITASSLYLLGEIHSQLPCRAWTRCYPKTNPAASWRGVVPETLSGEMHACAPESFMARQLMHADAGFVVISHIRASWVHQIAKPPTATAFDDDAIANGGPRRAVACRSPANLHLSDGLPDNHSDNGLDWTTMHMPMYLKHSSFHLHDGHQVATASAFFPRLIPRTAAFNHA